MDRLAGWRPEIGRDGEDAVSPDRLCMARERHRIFDRERADMDGHRHASRDDLHGSFSKALALRDGEAQRLALVMRPRDRRRAGADVEVEHFLEGRKVEAVVVLEWRHRALHHAAELVLHACCPRWRVVPDGAHGATEWR